MRLAAGVAGVTVEVALYFLINRLLLPPLQQLCCNSYLPPLSPRPATIHPLLQLTLFLCQYESFVCLRFCHQDYAKTSRLNFMKLGGDV